MSRVRCVSIHGDHILSGSDDRSAKLWSSKSSSSSALLTLSGHAWPVSQVCLAARRALTADSCSVRVWALPGGQLLHNLVGQTDIVEMCTDPRLGLFIMCDGSGGLSCYGLESNKYKDREKTSEKKKEIAWSWRNSDSSDKLLCRAAVGHSTMIHVTYCEKQCDKVEINIHDFLC